MITNLETFRDDSIASNLWRRSAVAIPFWLTLAPQAWIYGRRDYINRSRSADFGADEANRRTTGARVDPA
jgi:hypothetical protein